jgi:hypothetical protein
MFSISRNVLYRTEPSAKKRDSSSELVIQRFKQLNLFTHVNELKRKGIIMNTPYKFYDNPNEFSINFQNMGNKKRRLN